MTDIATGNNSSGNKPISIKVHFDVAKDIHLDLSDTFGRAVQVLRVNHDEFKDVKFYLYLRHITDKGWELRGIHDKRCRNVACLIHRVRLCYTHGIMRVFRLVGNLYI